MIPLAPAEGQIYHWNLSLADLFPGATTKVRLYQNNFVPSYGMKLADFTEADFSGYSQQGVSVTQVGMNPTTGDIEVSAAGLAIFTQNAITITNTVYGWYLLDTVVGEVYLAGRFDTPYLMDTINKQIKILPIITSRLFSSVGAVVP